MARMGLDCGVLGTDHIDGSSSFHFLHTNLTVCRFWTLNLPQLRFGRCLIDSHDDRQGCAFRSGAGKLDII